MRITVDTGILVRMNVRANGPAKELLSAIRYYGARLVLSQFIVDEAVRVIQYPRLRKIYGLTPGELLHQLDELSANAEYVEPAFSRPVIPNDPNGDPVLFTAITGGAEFLCTIDRHFYQPGVLHYCSRYRIRVLSDVELLLLLRSRVS